MAITAINNEFSLLYACDFQHGEYNLNPLNKNTARQEVPFMLISEQSKPNTVTP